MTVAEVSAAPQTITVNDHMKRRVLVTAEDGLTLTRRFEHDRPVAVQ